MLPRNHLDRIQITFDDHRLVALHLGLPQLVDRHLDLGDAPDRANPGDKMITLVASARRIRGTGSGRRRPRVHAPHLLFRRHHRPLRWIRAKNSGENSRWRTSVRRAING